MYELILELRQINTSIFPWQNTPGIRTCPGGKCFSVTFGNVGTSGWPWAIALIGDKALSSRVRGVNDLITRACKI